MAIINPNDLTFNGEEIKSFNEAIYEATFAKPAISDFHTIYSDIKAKKQIVFLGRLGGLVGRKHDSANGCAPLTNPNGITNTEKFWMPAYIEDRLATCWDDFLETFMVYSLKNGIDKADITGTDIANFITERFQDEIYESVLRNAWFGDEDAAAYNASPAGTFYNNGNANITPAYFTPFDGLWKQIFAILAANPSRLTTDLATKNAQVTFALQAFNSTDTTNRVVTKAIQNVVFEADDRLRDSNNQLLLVTRSVADQYTRELEAEGVDGSWVAIQDGLATLKRGGLTLVQFSFWDRMIKAYSRQSNNINAYFRPHRILLTTKEQLGVGTEESGRLTEVDVHYDKTDKNVYFDFGYNLDAKFLRDYMVQAAY
jgi:hypothetical protein